MSPSDMAFSEELIAYWVSFIRSFDPNTFKLARSPQWPSYTKEQRNRMVLTEGTVSTSESEVELETEKENTRCALVAAKIEREQA